MFAVSDAHLQRFCTPPLDRLSNPAAHELAYAVLGPNLARWILRPEVLRRVAEHDRARGDLDPSAYWHDRPTLPIGSGACWVLFTQQDFPLLRPAFVLPLQWRPDQPHSRQLPPSLTELAEQVLDAAGLQGFGLYGSREAGIDDCDLSGLSSIDCSSAWVPLFGGLVMAAEGGLPDTGVWASGRWSATEGVQPIGQIEPKLEAAVEWGAKRFFLPDSQREHAEQWLAQRNTGLGVDVLEERHGNDAKYTYTARGALRTYLADFGAPPDPAAPREARKKYYLLQTDAERQRAYYRRCLLEDVADDCRRHLESEGHLPQPTHMVTVLSTSPELVELTVQVFRPSRVLVLYTVQTHKHLDDARSAIEQQLPGCEVLPEPFEVGDAMVPQMRTAVTTFTRGVKPDNILYDLLPGTKEMTLTLALELSRPGVWLYYLRHSRQGPLAVPFEQTPILRQDGRLPAS